MKTLKRILMLVGAATIIEMIKDIYTENKNQKILKYLTRKHKGAFEDDAMEQLRMDLVYEPPEEKIDYEQLGLKIDKWA